MSGSPPPEPPSGAEAVAIREMTLADTRAVGGLHVRAWQATYRGVIPDSYLDSLRPAESAELWRRAVSERHRRTRHLVAAAGTEPVGFAAVGPYRGDEPVGELYAINVDPAWMGRGVGRVLIGAAVDELAGAGHRHALLWVLRDNPRARRFYERNGWEADGTEKTTAFDGRPVLELRYARRLDPSC